MIDRFQGSARAVAWLAMAAILTATGIARADEEEREVVRHKVIIGCDEGEADCDERAKKIVIDAGNGEDLTWVSAHGDGSSPPSIHLGENSFVFGPPIGGGFLGVGLTEMTPELRRHFGAPEDAGVLIAKVVEGSPAEAAGLAVGDVVTRVDGEAVATGHELAHAIRAKEAGETASLDVWRDGKAESFTAVVGEQESPHRMRRRIVRCEGDGECDGPNEFVFLGSECPEGEPCEVEVRCDGGGECDCTVNGEAADCSSVRPE